MKRVLAAVVAALVWHAGATAGELSAPEGAVVLTVTGAIANSNGDGVAAFDLPALEALTGRSGTMETPWTPGKTTFSGPLLRAVLSAVGAQGKTIRLVALNDYAADIPLEDATDLDTILATRMDGKLMSVRDKGPVFLIYPFDQDPALYNEKYFSRSVWQIKEVKVLE
ncbi:molybdopterin-dependent oxidoreductase [Aureimonas glaciei]|uniref:Oxidoreductase n=1 Tax=Aureimonas glaciei TaxID=1776957 RepID=A0A916YDU9_9HYPH|nr:molybdopterin-dependent oxidoreductase [Aureimonas glaciei]GGD41391.1 oxidoreductase [Aureimonas glaciei]